MPKSKSKNSTKLVARLSRLGRTNLAIMAAFVLVFVTAGGLFVYRSEASTWYCAQHIYYQYEPGTWGGYCVRNIQFQLNLEMHAGLSVDGIYGPATAYAVRSFNRNYVGGSLYVDNSTEVTGSTWSRLCYWSHNYYYSLYNSDGCYAGNYGAYYVGMVDKPAVQYGLAVGTRPKGIGA